MYISKKSSNFFVLANNTLFSVLVSVALISNLCLVAELILYHGPVLQVCLLISIFSNIAGHQIINYAIGLVFLGIGWNFLFITGTTLLTKHYTFSERFKTQAANDFIIYSIMAIGSLSAGALIHYLGWVKLNLIMLPLLLVMIVFLIVYMIISK